MYKNDIFKMESNPICSRRGARKMQSHKTSKLAFKESDIIAGTPYRLLLVLKKNEYNIKK